MIISNTYIDSLCFTPDSENGIWISCIFTIKNNTKALCYHTEYDEINKIVEELHYYICKYERDYINDNMV